MKIKALLMVSAFLVLISCSKDNHQPQISFPNNLSEGTANSQGEYTLTGHISSPISLDKVTLTKEGEMTPFLIDESTAKNKNEYDFSYLVTGIVANTTVIIKAYDLEGGFVSTNFLIKK